MGIADMVLHRKMYALGSFASLCNHRFATVDPDDAPCWSDQFS
jgi:hypothetical protein